MTDQSKNLENPIQNVHFESMSSNDQAEKVASSVSNYLQSVEGRIEASNVSLLTGDIARYEALGGGGVRN